MPAIPRLRDAGGEDDLVVAKALGIRRMPKSHTTKTLPLSTAGSLIGLNIWVCAYEARPRGRSFDGL